LILMLRSAAVVATATLVLAASTAAAEAPRGVVANCSMQSGASFPRAFNNSRNLIVGPLAITGARGTPGFSTSFHGNKFPLLVRSGHRVTLELSSRTRKGAGLAYWPLPQGDIGVREAHRVVTFIACKKDEGSMSDVDGKPVTFWSGGIVAYSPRCIPIRIWVDREPVPRSVVIRLGVTRCG
jgi:hypothetical protein